MIGAFEERIRGVIAALQGERVDFDEKDARELYVYPLPELQNESGELKVLGELDEEAARALKALEDAIKQLDGLVVRLDNDTSFKIVRENLVLRVKVKGPKEADDKVTEWILEALEPFWELTEYVRYLVFTRREEMYAEQILLRLPKRIRPYVVVRLGLNDVVYLHVAKQIAGFVIGKSGSRVKELEETIKKRIKVEVDRELTRKFEENEDVEIRDPEVAKEVANAVALLKNIWEKYGISPGKIAKLASRELEFEEH